MRRFDVVANHDVWDVLDGDAVIATFGSKSEGIWHATDLARAAMPGRVVVTTADGTVESDTTYPTDPAGTWTVASSDAGVRTALVLF